MIGGNMATWIEDIKKALDNIGGVGEYSQIYDEIKKIRLSQLPVSWHAIVRKEIEVRSSDSEAFGGKEDLFYSVNGLGQGVWGLRNYISKYQYPSDYNDPPQTVRESYSVSRIIRDTTLSNAIKSIHKNKCQICGETITLDSEKTYSEGHHIVPLGAPHNGPDVAENIIVLCPNHHVMCDFGAIEIRISELYKHPKHSISIEYVNYHNRNIYKAT